MYGLIMRNMLKVLININFFTVFIIEVFLNKV